VRAKDRRLRRAMPFSIPPVGVGNIGWEREDAYRGVPEPRITLQRNEF
jgi:hypothetical protein